MINEVKITSFPVLTNMIIKLFVIASMTQNWSLLGVPATQAEESKDMTFSTEYAWGRPTTANFYLNGRAIGAGREAFAAIVEKVAELPAGSSIVWGPNYARCGACSGAEPDCVAKFLYPDLWKTLETTVQDHRLTLSNSFPGPWPQSVGFDEAEAMPVALPKTDLPAKPPFDATLDWEVDETLTDRYETLGRSEIRESHWYRFSSAGKTLHGYELRLFFGRLPEQSRVLIRVTLQRESKSTKRPATAIALADRVRLVWKKEIGDQLRRGKLNATLTAPAMLVEALRFPARNDRLTIDWSNFHGPKTPHQDVLYTVNDRFVGRGDEGFTHILAEVDKLPPGAEIVLPQYQYGGRAVHENYSVKEINAKNAGLRGVIPFHARMGEFDTAITKRKIKLTPREESPGEVSGTIVDWNSADRYGRAFVSYGRIIHHDEPKKPAAARLGWTRYDAGNSGIRDDKRKVESTAFYTVNVVETGQGVAGFAKAMEMLATLPKGSIVQVDVCLRTKGPFLCPITYENHRHFERTGFEPYVGMFPWLIDVARNRKLEIEWIPDEQKSCQDCQFNR